MLLRSEECDRKDVEKAQSIQIENMLANKATTNRRAREREREQHDTFLIQKKIHNDQTVYQKRLEEQKNGCGVQDLI